MNIRDVLPPEGPYGQTKSQSMNKIAIPRYSKLQSLLSRFRVVTRDKLQIHCNRDIIPKTMPIQTQTIVMNRNARSPL